MKHCSWLLVITVVLVGISLSNGCTSNKETCCFQTEVFATHVTELQSMETTDKVTKVGVSGFISTYWVESGLSSEYTLDEYKAATVVVSKGANVDVPVEGDIFRVPWPD